MKIAVGILLSIIIVLIGYPIVDVQLKDSQKQRNDKIKAEQYLIKEIGISYHDGSKETIQYRDYLIGCLFAQLPAFYEPEMLKAQAICANTYSIRMKLNGISTDDFKTESDGFQPFIREAEAREYYGDGYESALFKITEAVDFGINYVITYDGKPILPASHSISSGKTDSAVEIWGDGFPYLIEKESPADTLSEEYGGSKQLSSASVRGILMKRFNGIRLPTNCNEWFTNLFRSGCDTIIELKAGAEKLSGNEFMKLFSLRSANVDITYSNSIFTFFTKGCGHNIGLSIYGGNEMVKSGALCADVLKYYYDGVRIEKIPRI